MASLMMEKTKQSDKFFWHLYGDFYNSIMPKKLKKIIEIGVFNGDSIRYFRKKYPSATIIGGGILGIQKSWPSDMKISYIRLIQAKMKILRKFFQFLVRLIS